MQGDGFALTQVIEDPAQAGLALARMGAVALRAEPGAHAGVVEPAAQGRAHAAAGVAPLGLHGVPGVPGGQVVGPQDGARWRRDGGRSFAFDAQAERRGGGVQVVFVVGCGLTGILGIVWVSGVRGGGELTARPKPGQLAEFFRRPASPSLAKMAFW